MLLLFATPDGVGVRELPRPAPDRRRRHGVPAPQRPLVLAVPVRRADRAGRLPRRERARPTSAGRATRRSRPPVLAEAGHRPVDRRAWRWSGVAAILGALNFMVDDLRAPGARACTMLRMPMFTWTILVTSVLILFAFPVAHRGAGACCSSTATSGPAFFDPAQGGGPILWQHLFWFFGHPEVYILVLPFFGVIERDHPGVLRASRCSATAGWCSPSWPSRPYSMTRVGPPHVHDRARSPAVLLGYSLTHRRARPGSSSSTGSGRCGAAG